MRALSRTSLGCSAGFGKVAHGKDYLLGSHLSLADFYLLPSTYSFSFVPEAKAMYPKYPAFCRWRDRMEGLPRSRNCVQRYHPALRSNTPENGRYHIGPN